MAAVHLNQQEVEYVIMDKCINTFLFLPIPHQVKEESSLNYIAVKQLRLIEGTVG
jgi:hypothetical protein